MLLNKNLRQRKAKIIKNVETYDAISLRGVLLLSWLTIYDVNSEYFSKFVFLQYLSYSGIHKNLKIISDT